MLAFVCGEERLDDSELAILNSEEIKQCLENGKTSITISRANSVGLAVCRTGTVQHGVEGTILVCSNKHFCIAIKDLKRLIDAGQTIKIGGASTLSVSKDELHRLVETLPEKETAAAKKFLEFVMSEAAKKETSEKAWGRSFYIEGPAGKYAEMEFCYHLIKLDDVGGTGYLLWYTKDDKFGEIDFNENHLPWVWPVYYALAAKCSVDLEPFFGDFQTLEEVKRYVEGRSWQNPVKNLFHTLDEDFMNKRPLAFEIEGTLIFVKTWSEMVTKTCEILFIKNPNLVLGFVNDSEFQGTKWKYFSWSPKGMNQPKKVNGAGIYIETTMNANGSVRLIKKMIQKFNIAKKDYIIFLRSD